MWLFSWTLSNKIILIMTIYFYNNNVIETFWQLDRITNSAIFTKNVKARRKLDETEASTINSNILVPVWRNDVLEVPNWRWWRLKFRERRKKHFSNNYCSWKFGRYSPKKSRGYNRLTSSMSAKTEEEDEEEKSALTKILIKNDLQRHCHETYGVVKI